jgi:hypothetical protein
MKFYTTDDISKLQADIVNIRLIAPAKMVACKPSMLISVCNGIGAEWMSERSRKIITKLLYYAEATACIHDYEYYNSDGTEERRKAVDELFLINGLREVRSRYPQWWNIRRWLGERAVLIAHEVLSRTGEVAWQSAFADRVKRTLKQRNISINQFFFEEQKNEEHHH